MCIGEYLPIAIRCGLGMSFMDMTPKVFNVYAKAYSEKRKEEAELIEFRAWVYGIYTSNAIMSTIGNSSWFKDKNTKAHEYPKNPLEKVDRDKQLYSDDLTEEEKKRETELLFAKLNVMKVNFDLAHK